MEVIRWQTGGSRHGRMDGWIYKMDG